MRFDNCRFKNTDVELDDNEFYKCQFENCILVYRGGNAVTMKECSFKEVQVAFEDHAGNTIDFLESLYAIGFGPIIEEVFDTVRAKGVGLSNNQTIN